MTSLVCITFSQSDQKKPELRQALAGMTGEDQDPAESLEEMFNQISSHGSDYLRLVMK